MKDSRKSDAYEPTIADVLEDVTSETRKDHMSILNHEQRIKHLEGVCV